MTVGREPTLLQSMATSKPTRMAVVTLACVVCVMLCLASFAVGAVHATESRFEAIEAAALEDRGTRSRDEWTRRDVLDRLTTLETTQGAQGLLLNEVRDDVRAIRDAVAPMPRGGE